MMNYTDKTGDPAILLSGYPSFDQVLDSACDRLWVKKVELTLRRIRKLEDCLTRLEQELDDLILRREHDV